MKNYIISPAITANDQIPGESFLISCLQRQINFNIGNKTIKKGRLILFKRVHFFIQITLMTDKNIKENFEIPIPFCIEDHSDDKLMYFDYRLNSLNTKNLPPIPQKISSSYFNKILEVAVV